MSALQSLKMAFSFVALVSAFGCSQQRPSERDLNRQKSISRSEVKRSELSQVAGRYTGQLMNGPDYSQNVVLVLQVRDVPEENPAEGMDPVSTPKLIGYLRILSGIEDLGEYTDAPVKSAEYYVAQKRLNVVVFQSQFQDLILNLSTEGSSVTGTWGAAALGISGGTVSLTLESRN